MVENESDKTSIQLTKVTKADLATFAQKKDESFEEIIVRLMDFWRKHHAKT